MEVTLGFRRFQLFHRSHRIQSHWLGNGLGFFFFTCYSSECAIHKSARIACDVGPKTVADEMDPFQWYISLLLKIPNAIKTLLTQN